MNEVGGTRRMAPKVDFWPPHEYSHMHPHTKKISHTDKSQSTEENNSILK